MSESRDKKPAPNDAAAADKRSSGRVGFDSRGNSVWEWQVQTGVYSRDVNTESLRKLDLDELSLADTAAVKSLQDESAQDEPKPSAKAPVADRPAIDPKKAGGGFNPYDNATAHNTRRSDTRDPYDNARLRAAALAGKTAAAAPNARPAALRKPVAVRPASTDVRKLSGWLKLKRALLGKRD